VAPAWRRPMVEHPYRLQVEHRRGDIQRPRCTLGAPALPTIVTDVIHSLKRMRATATDTSGAAATGCAPLHPRGRGRSWPRRSCEAGAARTTDA